MKKLYAAILLCLLQLFAAAFAEVDWKESPNTELDTRALYGGLALVNAGRQERLGNSRQEGNFG